MFSNYFKNFLSIFLKKILFRVNLLKIQVFKNIYFVFTIIICICLCNLLSYPIFAEEICHPADTNQDWKITKQEFDAYNKAWSGKKSWPNAPVPIPINYLTRAGYLVTQGEAYHYEDENAPLCWKKGKIFRPETFTNSIGMTFVLLPSGTFMMGSPSNEPGRGSDENQHQVTLTKNFFMQTTEITQGQWKEIMGSNPSYFSSCGNNCPVEYVSWNNVQEFINKLNQKENTNMYRLPTEAEWEYAARAESGTAFANGAINETGCGIDPNLDEMGWYCGNAIRAFFRLNLWKYYGNTPVPWFIYILYRSL